METWMIPEGLMPKNTPAARNYLWWGDCITLMAERVPDEDVDLIYADPPFNSNAYYGIQYKNGAQQKESAQQAAFTDVWDLGSPLVQRCYAELRRLPKDHCLYHVVHSWDRMSPSQRAYMAFMTRALMEMHRVLKKGGSLYLHVDDRMSRPLGYVLDMLFGPEGLGSQIVWPRLIGSHNDAKGLQRVYDMIFYYTKTSPGVTPTWNRDKAQRYLDEDYVKRAYKHKDKKGVFKHGSLTAGPLSGGGATFPWSSPDGTIHTGPWWVSEDRMKELAANDDLYYSKPNSKPRKKVYLKDEMTKPVSNVWEDIPPLGNSSERRGYDTQKPEALLHRIIEVSSNQNDMVLDPFAGSGTTGIVAQRLNRRWWLMDVEVQAVHRIMESFEALFNLPGDKQIDFKDKNWCHHYAVPYNLDSALELAKVDPIAFELWVARVVFQAEWTGLGADKGRDGILYFLDENDRTQIIWILVTTSSSAVKRQLESLENSINKGSCTMGFLVTPWTVSGTYIDEVNKFNLRHGDYSIKPAVGEPQNYPRIQLFSAEDHFAGRKVILPPLIRNPEVSARPSAVGTSKMMAVASSRDYSNENALDEIFGYEILDLR